METFPAPDDTVRTLHDNLENSIAKFADVSPWPASAPRGDAAPMVVARCPAAGGPPAADFSDDPPPPLPRPAPPRPLCSNPSWGGARWTAPAPPAGTSG